MKKAVDYRRAVLLATYFDKSELLYLQDEKRYVWMRPNKNRTKMAEIRIQADSHQQAVIVVRRRLYIDWDKHVSLRFKRK